MIKYPEILEYIPQKQPFVLIDTLLNTDEKCSTTTFTIPETHVLLKDNTLLEAGLIENIAQTVAVGAGYRLKQEGKSAKTGFIAAVKRLSIEKRPCSGSKIITRVELISAFENAMVVHGEIDENGTIIAKCQMNIFIIDKPNFIQS